MTSTTRNVSRRILRMLRSTKIVRHSILALAERRNGNRECGTAQALAGPSFVPELISPGKANSTVATCPNPEATTVYNQINAANEPAANKSTNGNMDTFTITMQ